MARMVFVQDIFREYPAPMALAAEVQRYRHLPRVVVARGERDVLGSILTHHPDLVGFSPTAYDIAWCLSLATKLQSFGSKSLWAGPWEPVTRP
jgi:hypothetical protein